MNGDGDYQIHIGQPGCFPNLFGEHSREIPSAGSIPVIFERPGDVRIRRFAVIAKQGDGPLVWIILIRKLFL